MNGKPYVVGDSTERHSVLIQRSGSARYTRDYYGILATAALARLYERRYVDEATSLFLNKFSDTYQRIAGSALAWDTIILTGGDNALLQQKLLPILNHENVILADQLDSLYLANVRGGLKLWRLYDSLKLL